MKILLTGACGNVGFETLKKLVESGNEITVIELASKRNMKKLNQYKNKVNIVFGSILNENLIHELMINMDVVIHLAAIIPPLADEKPDLARQVNYYGTLNIVNAIKKQEKKPFLIYSSSISVYGDRLENYEIQVGDMLKSSPKDYYADTKIEAENLIQSADIPFTIFRLGAVMGLPTIDPLMFHMPLKTKIEIVSNTDVGIALTNAIQHLEELKGGIYNLGGGEKCRTSYHEFLYTMFKIYGLNTRYIDEKAFASQDFHCGYYIDGYKLNDILHFQNDTLETYYKKVDNETKSYKKMFSKIFSLPIIYFLQKKSDFLKY